MKFSTSLLLPTIIGVASATSEAIVYIFQGTEWPNSVDPPSLSPEQARLVIAQRLGVSKWHGLGDSSDSKISYVNEFGGVSREEESVFHAPQGRQLESLLVLDRVSSENVEKLSNAWSSIRPAFTIANPPSSDTTSKLVRDLRYQTEGDAHVSIGYDDLSYKEATGISDLLAGEDRIFESANKEGHWNSIIVVIPESPKSPQSSYGSYDLPEWVKIDRRQEEPMEFSAPVLATSFESSQSSEEPITGVPALCYSSIDACNSGTRNCSGHGECGRKSGNGPSACYACACVATRDDFVTGENKRPGFKLTYWGGSACQKKDVSGPFWLIAIFSVVMVGLVGWAIGLIFSIGEEKLPGVIGAGVSSNKSR